MESKRTKEEISSLNKSFLDEISMEELESRLETDPLAVGQLLQLSTDPNHEAAVAGCCLFTNCNGNEEWL